MITTELITISFRLEGAIDFSVEALTVNKPRLVGEVVLRVTGKRDPLTHVFIVADRKESKCAGLKESWCIAGERNTVGTAEEDVDAWRHLSRVVAAMRSVSIRATLLNKYQAHEFINTTQRFVSSTIRWY